jgi:hypothetical protein
MWNLLSLSATTPFPPELAIYEKLPWQFLYGMDVIDNIFFGFLVIPFCLDML